MKKKTKSNGEEMREIGVLAVADDEHGCESSGGKGRRTATRRREARRRVGVLWRTPSGARTLTGRLPKGRPRVLRGHKQYFITSAFKYTILIHG